MAGGTRSPLPVVTLARRRPQQSSSTATGLGSSCRARQEGRARCGCQPAPRTPPPAAHLPRAAAAAAMLDDDLPTSTSAQQTALEKKIAAIYQARAAALRGTHAAPRPARRAQRTAPLPHPAPPRRLLALQELEGMEGDEVTEALRLLRYVHVEYLHHGMGLLPAGFASLDASRPWIAYWLVHSLALLGAGLPAAGPNAADVIAFLKHCQCPRGGFGGSPMQIAHLAPSYAAVCTLVDLGGEAALQAVDRAAMFGFLCRMAISPEQGGGFCIHEGGSLGCAPGRAPLLLACSACQMEWGTRPSVQAPGQHSTGAGGCCHHGPRARAPAGGEGDLRACYIALAIAHMLHLDKEELVARSGVAEYVKRCQVGCCHWENRLPVALACACRPGALLWPWSAALWHAPLHAPHPPLWHAPHTATDVRGRARGRARQRGARRLHVLRAGRHVPHRQGARAQPACAHPLGCAGAVCGRCRQAVWGWVRRWWRRRCGANAARGLERPRARAHTTWQNRLVHKLCCITYA